MQQYIITDNTNLFDNNYRIMSIIPKHTIISCCEMNSDYMAIIEDNCISGLVLKTYTKLLANAITHFVDNTYMLHILNNDNNTMDIELSVYKEPRYDSDVVKILHTGSIQEFTGYISTFYVLHNYEGYVSMSQNIDGKCFSWLNLDNKIIYDEPNIYKPTNKTSTIYVHDKPIISKTNYVIHNNNNIFEFIGEVNNMYIISGYTGYVDKTQEITRIYHKSKCLTCSIYFNKKTLEQNNGNCKKCVNIEQQKDAQKKRKEKISASLRNSLWINHNGDTNTSKCYCCKTEQITRGNFEAGHVVSEKNGGLANISNLKPICSLCNKSMGTQNMHEFMDKCGYVS